ncbi:MAG TPA: recombinase family protein [bacterium]|nr:MAG: DNA-invertase hin [bacterium ADurb.Bin236]HPI77039.1 recombinase family protein [bacterium]
MARRNMSVVRQEPVTAPVVRCAIYTRKSTSEGLDMDFNTLDAQRESCEAYIKSQQGAGWTALAEQYDDGGFTGGNTERPAFKRMMADIKEGKVDCVLVYKVDRLSRSLFDFAKIMELFEKHNVSFVSITQEFNTSTSMGRLMLNVLLSFAQFERELVSERTRDKIAAARKKGKWPGGSPVLGYDIDPDARRLVINEPEVVQVKKIFELYLENQSIMSTVETLNDMGMRTKSWVTRKGVMRGGHPFDKARLHRLLTNVAYIGKVPHKDKVYEGEHDAILDNELWDKTQFLMITNAKTGGKHVKNKYGALLRGLVVCGSCGCSMIHTFTQKGNRTYRYYLCSNAHKQGWKCCPTKTVSAGQLEQFVVGRIRDIGKNSTILEETIKSVIGQRRDKRPAIIAEVERLRNEIERLKKEGRRLVEGFARCNSGTSPIIAEQITRVDESIAEKNRLMSEARERLLRYELETVDTADIRNALAAFDPIWDVLYVREKTRIVQMLVQKVVYDGVAGTVGITFHPNGIKQLAKEMVK